MTYICSIYLAEEAHWGSRGWFVQAGESIWLHRATIYQEVPPQMCHLWGHRSALRDCDKESPEDSQQKLSGYRRGPRFEWEAKLQESRPKPHRLGALDLGQQTCDLPSFHKWFFSFFGASADPMGYSSSLVSATCPGRL